MARILIVGVGNLLRRDDGFGVEVARRLLARRDLPAAVKVIEIGIAGISLVQELFEGFDVLIVADAMDRGEPPGRICLMTPTLPDLAGNSQAEPPGFLAGGHDMEPSKALILAAALGVLPSTVWVVGCQPLEYQEPGIGLSEPVQEGVGSAVEAIVALVRRLSGQSPVPMREDT